LVARVIVCHMVVAFPLRGCEFVPGAEVEGEARGDSEVILKIGEVHTLFEIELRVKLVSW